MRGWTAPQRGTAPAGRNRRRIGNPRMTERLTMTALTELETEIRDGVDRETIETVQAMAGKYKHGWETDIEMEYAPKGLSEDIVRLISAKNGEPEWMLDWRLAAYRAG
jgi:hypothetical protein